MQYREVVAVTNALASFGGNNLPIILAGDFNAAPESYVHDHMLNQGFISTYAACSMLEANQGSASRTLAKQNEPKVTHRNHRGDDVVADYIWYFVPVSKFSTSLQCKYESQLIDLICLNRKTVVYLFNLRTAT